MTYKDSLIAAMKLLSADPKVRFIGYGLLNSGAWKHIPREQIVETTVAENLMVGMATGMSIWGLRPVVFIERFDFLLNAMDAIVNHLDKIAEISGGEFEPAVILRVVVGNRVNGLMTGATHTQDFTDAMTRLVKFPVVKLRHAGVVDAAYADAYSRMVNERQSTLLVEYKDLIDPPKPKP